MAELTHWKKLVNPDYIGAYALQPGEEPVLTIKTVGREMVVSEGGRKEECTVAHFVENVKPMILNRTNCKTISDIYGTPFIEEWAGKKVQLFATTTMFKGEEVEALRIRTKAPVTQKPVLSKDSEKWDAAITSLRCGETSIAAIQKKYSIPKTDMPEMEAAEAEGKDA